MGMPALPRTGWTADLLEALPDDGKRYEIIDGELFVTPVPSVAHQRVVGALYSQLRAFLQHSAVGEVILSPADLRSGPRTSVQPDLFVVRGPVRLGSQGWPELDALLLAIEVLSPRTARVDRGVKRHLYQRMSVAEYWIVDLDSRLIERWRPVDERPEILRETIEWHAGGVATPLVIALPPLFAEALAE